jgi:hypothetical protein
MGMYLRDFPKLFGEVPVRDIGLLASEGRMSIPLEDDTPTGMLDVVSNFFEFVPVDEHESEKPAVLRCHEVEEGREYFVLLTNSAGFYRYDIGDCVRVNGFQGQAPMIEFLHKGLHVSSLAGEKLTERQVVLAFEQAAGGFAGARRSFVVAAQWGNPPFYRLHVEEAAGMDAETCDKLAVAFDRQLGAVNIEYASKRKSGRLGQVAWNVLPAQWLTNRDRELATQRRRVNEQFKHRYLYGQLGEDDSFPKLGPRQAVSGNRA